MGEKQHISLTCDLCKWPAKQFNSTEEAEDVGWVKVGHECYYTDRDFYHLWVCPSCTKSIVAQVQKRIKNKPVMPT